MTRGFDATVPDGIYTAADLGMSVSANWTLTGFNALHQGLLRVVNINLTYGGATVTAPTNGDITDLTPFAGNLPAGWLPAAEVAATGARVGQHGATVILSATGTILLIGMDPGTTITSGSVVTFGFTYPALA